MKNTAPAKATQPSPGLLPTKTLAAPTAQATSLPAPSPTAATARLWIAPNLPAAFREQFQAPPNLEITSERASANLYLEIPPVKEQAATPDCTAHWIYALAAPFPTIQDAVDASVLRAAWSSAPQEQSGGNALLMSAETRAVLEDHWGPAGAQSVRTVDPAALLDTAWKEQSFAIIPFEEIQPRWKVLNIRDGSRSQSPLEKSFDPLDYPLAVPICIRGNQGISTVGLRLPTNRDPQKLTVLVMTGVTALSRHIGERMESKGLTYPAEDIRPWLADADLTHISNEVSFYSDCPRPGPERADMRFCSNPRYIRLLEDVGTDIVELTGNHNLDWGRQPFLDSLEMYRQRGWLTYGGGANLSEAQQPVLLEHNGNKIAFLGCSPAGPEKVWATDTSPGSAPCNYERMEQEVASLREQGYLPVVTLQAVETDVYAPPPAQGTPNFRRLAQAGAVIVSGSQSHVPQTMTFVNGGSFVHYGLGNLFFDQMKPPETRQEFIDRHVFYNGKYLGVELLTALLEDYARPRPMTVEERGAFLQKIFSLSTWVGN